MKNAIENYKIKLATFAICFPNIKKTDGKDEERLFSFMKI